MKVIVCGDRHWGGKAGDEQLVINRLMELPYDTRLVHGGAKGADLMAAAVAAKLNATCGWRFLIEEVRAEWGSFGRAAGPIRNLRMLRHRPELVLAFHHSLPSSKGTANMIALARKNNVPVEVIG